MHRYDCQLVRVVTSKQGWPSLKPVKINKAEILSTNSANERPHEETLYDLIQPSKL